MKPIKGKVWTFDDDVNTDVIYPGKYLAVFDPEEMATHAFEAVYPEFTKTVSEGDIIVAGKYFGCGSSREQAATCLKYLGIGCVVAESFARIYFRNAINRGLPILVCPGISGFVEQGQELEVDLGSGEVRNLSTGASLRGTPLPEFVLGILEAGGLIPYLKGRVASEGAGGKEETHG
jgi:3-isopropylmalate/(R)-2-methylmalate dehydratase small subunit